MKQLPASEGNEIHTPQDRAGSAAAAAAAAEPDKQCEDRCPHHGANDNARDGSTTEALAAICTKMQKITLRM